MRDRRRENKYPGGFAGLTPAENPGYKYPGKGSIVDKLIIHQIAWDELYRRMLFDYSIPSLVNDVERLIAAGVEVEWIVHTDNNSKKEYDRVKIDYRSFNDTIHFFNNTIAIATQAQRQGAYLALISPDNIFGKNSLYNAYMLARHKDTSIAIAHPRALAEEFMKKFPPGLTYTNRELVSIVMSEDLMHPALRFAFDDLDSSFTNQGISIRRMGKNTYGVVHTLPSGVIFKFNESDIKYLTGGSWGEIDRGLNIKLFAEKRIKLVGCSDMCFFIELTRPTHNFSFLYPNLKNNDRHMDERQNIFNNTIVVWIGK
jgi:hypothetical protein